MLWFLADPLYLVVTLVGLGLSLWAQAKVKRSFKAFDAVPVRSGMSGAEAAAAVCRTGGAGAIRIERSRGFLSDHYDPRSRTLRLSPDVYDGRSVSAVAVAAHEAGHAIQHAQSYGPLAIRNGLVPMASVGSQLSVALIFGGFLLSMFMGGSFGMTIAVVGLGMFALVVLFQLVNLPVEFNASSRAKARATCRL